MKLPIALLCMIGLLAAARPTAIDQAAEIRFVDAHVHLNDPDSALALLSRSANPASVAFIGARGTNQSVLDAARASNGRLIPFASITPERREYRDRWMRNDTSVVIELDRMLETGGFRGIGEISVVHFPGDGFPEADFDPMGPVMQGIMRVAMKRRLPVLIHCEVTRLREFSALLKAYPTVSVIWAHGGYTQYFLAARMLENHPNLFYELSARTWTSHPRSPDYTIFRDASTVWREWIALIERYPDRFIVGTDASLRTMENEVRKIERVRLFLGQLTDSTRAKVASRTIEGLVGGPK